LCILEKEANMAVANTPFNISTDSQAGVIAFLTQSQTMINQQWNVREEYEQN
jgi:hypothetical protein